jgi:signal transduction histidine kinase
LRFLAEAGALVPASLDEAELLSGVTRLAVRTLADWAAVYLQGEGETLQRAAVTHRDPARAALAEDLERAYPPRLDEDSPLLQTLREGAPRLVPTVDAEGLARYARDPQHLHLLQALGCTSALFVPLIARGRVLGVLGLFVATAGRRFSAEDLALTEEVGRRTALALDNARLYTRARDAVRARDEFLSIAAHELRTPVTIVTGLAQLLQRDRRRGSLDEARLDRALKLIAESSARLAALTDDLLDVSRLQTGHFAVRAEPVNLVSFVRALVERDAERLDERRRLNFGAGGEDAVACVVNADPVRLEQVLVNLIDNAVKYSPDGGPVDVAVRRAGPDDAAGGDAPAGGAIVEVRDQGIGVPPGAETTIFQPFGRAPNAAARQIRGMGLGLYLCRNIVERHGGRIWAESPGEGQGTTVRVWLPTVAAPDGVPTTAPAPSVAGADGAGGFVPSDVT